MKEYIVHLIPLSSYEIALHSDTIFGAICWGIRLLFGEDRLVQVLEEFRASPPFLVSSAFPCRTEGKEYKYYLPKPVLKPLTIIDFSSERFIKKASRAKETYHSEKLHTIEIANKYKKFRKIKLVGLSNFNKILKSPDEAELFADYLDGLLKEPKYCSIETTQKNSLDRITNSTTGSGNTFYAPEIVYKQNYGLYFLLQTQNINEYLNPVLRFLEDSGIGPNARTGKNWFKVVVVEKSLFDANNSQPNGLFITLSRYIKNERIYYF